MSTTDADQHQPALDPSTPQPPHDVPAHVDLPALERDILAFWDAQDVFDRSLAQTDGAWPWTFYEGPPTANGMPGTHHIEARVFKDVFPRYRTMRGFHVARKAGWDCQGLHVEVGVEKELGVSGKKQIEAYGVARFNQACRESVLRNVDAFEALTRRMGYWVDMDDAYRTMDRSYIESVWWSLKQIHGKGLLVEDYRISPYCPRCETALSDHELGQPGTYTPETDPSVYVAFPLTSGPYAGDAALLVWTTTPWTLVTNALVAVKHDVTYVTASKDGRTLVVAEPLVDAALGDGWTVQDRFTGADMAGWSYRRPLDLVAWPAGAAGHFVVTEDYVTTDEGTGLVHQSPAFGQDDFDSCRRHGVPLVNPIERDGHFNGDVDLVGGQYFKDADAALVAELDRRGLLFRAQRYEHSYPHCWRCETALLYYALPAWYIRTTAVKDELLRENERTHWYPQSVQWGRYGEWLHNNVDWSLSRTRFWGTPLPIWRCENDHQVCVGSLAELADLSGTPRPAGTDGVSWDELDPHRPYVDDITFTCATCGQECRRVPDVIDAWYDSGAMPFAQWGYPYADGSKERFDGAYPAQFICEAIDQTRGWFYSLMAIGTLLFDRSSYENVVCLGLLLAEDGRKMSKHLGNIVEPMPLLERHGADAVRWFMACSGSPWSARRVGDATLQEIVRGVLLTYWNTVAFHALYARTAGWTPAVAAPDPSERPVLDRWLVSELNRLVIDTIGALDNYDTQTAGARLAAFVDNLSNWYVRRSRRRFWDGDPAALATLHETLDTLTRLMAPITPFVTERVWQEVIRPSTPDAAESVHLARWPGADLGLVDDEMARGMALARRLVELGRAARAEAKVRTRQPLARALVTSSAYDRLTPELRAEVADELNVATVEPLSAAGAHLVQYTAKANFRALGKRFGKATPTVAAAIAAADADRLAAALAADGTVELDVDGEATKLAAEEVLLSERPREGWAVVNEQGETVALDLELTPDLVRAGLLREVVRLVQEARRHAGLQVSDRIRVHWQADGELARALADGGSTVADEVLATTFEPAAQAGAPDVDDAELGLRVWLAKA